MILKSIKEGMDSAEENLKSVADSTDKTATKVGFQERRMMSGSQGYQIREAIRQVHNSFEEWDPLRCESYFSGVVINEYLKWCNATGGRMEPHEDVWR